MIEVPSSFTPALSSNMGPAYVSVWGMGMTMLGPLSISNYTLTIPIITMDPGDGLTLNIDEFTSPPTAGLYEFKFKTAGGGGQPLLEITSNTGYLIKKGEILESSRYFSISINE